MRVSPPLAFLAATQIGLVSLAATVAPALATIGELPVP
jgi:hypothetical protein